MGENLEMRNAQTCLISGSRVSAEKNGIIPVIDPSNAEVYDFISAATDNDIDQAVHSARSAFHSVVWQNLNATDRGRLLQNLSAEILKKKDVLAEVEARDTGKPMSQAQADILACARYFEFYGGAADKHYGSTLQFLQNFHAQTIRQPLGVTGHIIPWNYPAQMFARSVGPSLTVGNTVVVKPAEDACQTPILLAQIATEVGFPDGTINLVTGYGEEAGASLAKHKDVNFLSFTGSPEVGTLVQAAAATNHIGCTLELGGKSPQIIFEDANIEDAISAVVAGITQNGGQTCSAGSRVLIQKTIYRKCLDILAEKFSSLVAAPWQDNRQLGPMISLKQKQRVEDFIAQGGSPDAPLVATGKILETANEAGFFVTPSLFAPSSEFHPLAQEEIFGPVLACLSFETETDATRIANSTPYGLVASIWSADGNRQFRMAKALRGGQIFINCFGAGGGVELPFGGSGKSGHGREKGLEALNEFSQIKTIIHKYN